MHKNNYPDEDVLSYENMQDCLLGMAVLYFIIMHKELEKFQFTENQSLYVSIIDGKEYFLAKNVCDILELGNTAQALTRVEKEDIILNDTPTKGGMQKMSFVNEAGLYALIFESRKPQAKEFKKWVFSEVLPQIRKTGKYETNPFAIASRKDLLKLALEQEEKIEKLAIENQKQESVIKEYFAIDDNKTYTDVAKILHLPPLKFTLALKKLHYIRDNRMPYQKYIDCGYFIIKKTIKKYQNGLTKHFESYLITPKGFQYFSKKFNTISLT